MAPHHTEPGALLIQPVHPLAALLKLYLVWVWVGSNETPLGRGGGTKGFYPLFAQVLTWGI